MPPPLPPLDPLPPPASGLFLEVSFRRLLASCEATAAGTPPPGARPELAGDGWRVSPVFHHYVETLQEQLADLQAEAPAKRPAAPLLAAYADRVTALASSLRPPSAPAYVRALPRGAGTGAQGATPASAAAAAAVATAAPAPAPASLDPDAARRDLLAGARPAPPAPHARVAGGGPPASLAGLTAGTASAVARERDLQDTLTDDLAGLASRLRANAEAAARAVADRGQLLDAAETTVDGARGAAARSVAEARAVYRTNRRGFWATCAAFLAVGAAFTAAFVFIRATSLLGYSSRRAARAAAARAERAAAAAGAAAREGAGAAGGGGGAGGEL